MSRRTMQMLQEQYLPKLRHVLSNMKEHPDMFSLPVGSGDGIIYVGGGSYWLGIVVGIKLLRYLGCNLPIEVWYLGDRESVNLKDVEGLNVTLIDSTKHPMYQGGYTHPGWVNKLFALTNTEFDRVLFLDADAYCVSKPDPLFDMLKEHSFIYWQDMPHQIKTVKWQEVYPEGERVAIPPVQGGQLFIDRIKASTLVRVANYLCENSDYYFTKMYGDQDTWRIGLAAGLCQYKTLGEAKWSDVAFVCSYPYPIVVHRCQGKLFRIEDIPANRVRYSNPHYKLPKEAEVFEIMSRIINGQNQESGKVFESIYSKRLWGSVMSSGEGSSVKQAAPYLTIINELIRSKGYQSIVDVGCGNGYIGSMLKVPQYIGYDCSETVLREAKRKFRKLSLFPLDIYTEYDIIQTADCLLCKDVLHHWPNEKIRVWLDCLIRSKKWKAIVITVDRNQLYDNQDCYLGGYRALDYTMRPLSLFNFRLIGEYLHKSVLIWDS